MTKHRSPEERIDEILAAAVRVIEDEGYERLTMERIVARTSLSKGGVYRFFANKRAVVVALIRRNLEPWTTFDVATAVGWNLPLSETIMRLAFGVEPDEIERRRRRLWLQLLPATMTDPEYSAERQRFLALGRRRYHELVQGILARDGKRADPDLGRRLEQVVALGAVFMDGVILASLGSERWQELEQMVRQFVEAMLSKIALPVDAPLSGAA